jgi:hypothetical protein
MAVTVVLDALNMTRQHYDEISKKTYFPPGKLPRGLVHHIASEHNGGLRIVEVWDSEADCKAYFEDSLAPATKEAGVELTASQTSPVVRMRSRTI